MKQTRVLGEGRVNTPLLSTHPPPRPHKARHPEGRVVARLGLRVPLLQELIISWPEVLK